MANILRIIWLATRKEFAVWLRDPKIFAASVFAPTVLLLAFYLVFGPGSGLKLAVTDLDGGPAAQRLIEILGSKQSQLGGPYFQVIPMGAGAARERWEQERLLAWVTIPQGFDLKTGATLELKLYNTNTDFAKNVRLYLNEAFVALYDEALPQARLTIEERHEAGVKIGAVDSIGMGTIGLAVVLAGLFNGFNSLLSEYRNGTIKTLLLSPRPVWVMLAAKVLYAVAGAILSGLLLLTALHFLTGFPLTQGLGGFFLLVVLTALIYTALGMIASLYIRRYMTAAALSMTFGVVTWFLSGSLGSRKAYSQTIQAIATVLPNTYAQEGLRVLLLTGDWRLLWGNSAVLGLFLLLAFVALTAVVRRRFTFE